MPLPDRTQQSIDALVALGWSTIGIRYDGRGYTVAATVPSYQQEWCRDTLEAAMQAAVDWSIDHHDDITR